MSRRYRMPSGMVRAARRRGRLGGWRFGRTADGDGGPGRRMMGVVEMEGVVDDRQWAGPEPPRADKRRYFVLMGICIGLFVLSWAVVDRYSVLAAVIMSGVALAIPPFAAIIANVASATDRRRR